MTGVVPFKRVKLVEREIPGATLPYVELTANSVTHLRRFLACRGITPKNVRKDNLIKLARQCLEQNTPIDGNVDGGVWLSKNVAVLRAVNINTAVNAEPSSARSRLDIFPVMWKPFPSLEIPDRYCYGSIYEYLIETAKVILCGDEENANVSRQEVLRYDTAKPLKKGRELFRSGFVGEIQDGLSNTSKHYCVKSVVQASMRACTYTVCIMICYTSGIVLDASCECKASSMGRCSHVAALLFAIEDYTIVYGNAPVSCTSMLCAWNKGGKRKDPKQIYLTKYSNTRDPSRLITFNPLRQQDSGGQDLLAKCQAFGKPTGWELSLVVKYDDYDLTPAHVDVLLELIDQLKAALKFGFEQPGEIPNTTLQSSSTDWHRFRRILITASTAHRFLHIKDESISKALEEHMCSSSTFVSVAMEYGRTNEKKARQQYVEVTGHEVTETGLWVNPRYPGIGASPDGIVKCRTTSTLGVLEIKCPFVSRDFAPSDIEKLSNSQKYTYCLEKKEERGETITLLKRNHRFFTQVQIQMGVLQVEWCDFVVWSEKGLFIERIPFSEEFWRSNAEKLCTFHTSIFCPEYFEMRIPRKLLPLRLEMNSP